MNILLKLKKSYTLSILLILICSTTTYADPLNNGALEGAFIYFGLIIGLPTLFGILSLVFALKYFYKPKLMFLLIAGICISIVIFIFFADNLFPNLELGIDKDLDIVYFTFPKLVISFSGLFIILKFTKYIKEIWHWFIFSILLWVYFIFTINRYSFEQINLISSIFRINYEYIYYFIYSILTYFILYYLTKEYLLRCIKSNQEITLIKGLLFSLSIFIVSFIIILCIEFRIQEIFYYFFSKRTLLPITITLVVGYIAFRNLKKKSELIQLDE